MKDEILEHELLQDYYTTEQAKVLQLKWSNIKNKLEKEKKQGISLKKIKYIAGVDISFTKEKNPKWGIACAVLWDYKKNILIEHKFAEGRLNFPYQAGFLGFRENRLIAKAILELQTKPDIIMCDGHGIIHPRNFGEAVHLGIALDIPSFGVAKNPFIGYTNFSELIRKKGEKTPVWSEKPDKKSKISPKIIGNTLCVTDNCKPVFISEGYLISLDNAIKIALDTSIDHRQPEPVFLADHLSREKIKNFIQ